MDMMSVLATAIGLVTVYLVLALAVTSANEGLAAILSSRGKWLKRGVLNLLSPAGEPGGWRQRLAAQVPADPAGASATPANARVATPGLTRQWAGKVASSLVADPGRRASLTQCQQLVDATYRSPFISHLAQGPVGHGYTPSYIPAWTLLQGMLHAVAQRKDELITSVDQIKAAAEKLPEGSPVRQAVLTLISECGGSMTLLRKGFEDWFADFESQLIAWYRQRTQWVVSLLAVLIVVVANADTFSIVRQLSVDPKLREAVAAEGVKLSEKGTLGAVVDTRARDEAKAAYEAAQARQRAADQARAASSPATVASVPATGASVPTLDEAWARYAAEQQKVQKQTDELRTALESTGLKLGWGPGEWSHLCDGGFAKWGLKLLGLLLSALAVSLGAPFWFDVLKSLASIRSVGLNLSEQGQQKAKKTTT